MQVIKRSVHSQHGNFATDQDGSGMWIRFWKRRRKAGSNSHGQLVAQSRKKSTEHNELALSNPSICRKSSVFTYTAPTLRTCLNSSFLLLIYFGWAYPTSMLLLFQVSPATDTVNLIDKHDCPATALSHVLKQSPDNSTFGNLFWTPIVRADCPSTHFSLSPTQLDMRSELETQ